MVSGQNQLISEELMDISANSLRQFERALRTCSSETNNHHQILNVSGKAGSQEQARNSIQRTSSRCGFGM